MRIFIHMVKNKEDIKDYLYSIQNELNIMNNALNEVETISPLVAINICNKLAPISKELTIIKNYIRINF